MPVSHPSSPSLLLRLPDAAALIGYSTRWLQERIAAGGVPIVNIEGRARMRRTDVEAFARDGHWPLANPYDAVFVGTGAEITPHVPAKKGGAGKARP